ncbi:MAG: hypothetical protein PHE20_00655 [Patescibacteria group bacterium]|nr:hypothetical protein [Patescibacteria group bacterium]
MLKITLRTTIKMLGLLFIPIVFCFLFVPQTLAAVGLSVGSGTLNLGSAENLFYGNIGSASHASSSFLLLQKNSANIFKIDNFGNVSTPGVITATGGFVGSITGGVVNAENVSAGDFGAETMGGDYSFPGKVGIGTTDPEYKLTIRSDNLGISSTPVMSLRNSAAATLSLQQRSPAIILEGQGWNYLSQTSAPIKALIDILPLKKNTKQDVTNFTESTPLFVFKSLTGEAGEVTNLTIGTDPRWDRYTNFWAGEVVPNENNFSWQLKNSGAEQWFNSTGVTLFTINNVPKLNVKTQGILIGSFSWNATASQALHVIGNARVTGAYYDSSNSAGSSGAVLTSTGTGTSWSDIDMTDKWTKGGDTLGEKDTLGSIDLRDIGFKTNNQERLTILSDGNVGIGTTNPTTKLYVNGGTGDAVNVGGGRIRGLNTTPVNADEAVPLTYLQSNYGTSANELWKGTINGNIWNGDSGAGNVGIGTTEPSTKLDIQSVKAAVRIKSTTGTNYSTFYLNNAGGDFYVGRNNSVGTGLVTTGGLPYAGTLNAQGVYPLQFATNNSVAMTIINGGNVGVGTATPGVKLDVADGLIRQSGFLVSDAISDNMLVNGDFEMNSTLGWSGLTGIATEGVSGKYAAEIVGYRSISSYDYIPVNPTEDIFQLEAWVKKSYTGTNPGLIYFGYYAYDGDKNLITSAPCGTYCYFAASGYTIPDNGAWHKLSSVTTGEGTSYPNFPVGTRYVKIMGLINYNSTGNSITLLDHVTLKRIYKGPLIAGNNFSSSNRVDNYQYSTLYTTANNLIIDTVGNVGIGTTNPTTKLYVNAGTGDVVNVGGGRIRGLNTTPVNADEAVPLTYLQSNYAPIGSGAGSAFVQGGNSFGSIANLGTNDNYPLNIETNNAIRMTVLGNGNVGIGTTAPNNLLQVAGLINFNDTDFNTFIGRNAGLNVVAGAQYNTFLGYEAGRSAGGTGAADFNVAVGRRALYSNSTGSYNVAQGVNSLYDNTTGIYNVAQGSNALIYNITGNYNSALGSGAGSFITDGTTKNTTGDYNLFLGVNTKALADNDQNEIVIGYNATGLGSNTVVLGNDSITKTALKGNVGIGTTNPTTKLYVNGGTGDAVNVGGGRIRGLNTTPVNADEAVPLTYLQSNYGTSASELWKGTINGNIWNGDSGAGNVGIGITNPTAKLQVSGNITSTDNVHVGKDYARLILGQLGTDGSVTFGSSGNSVPTNGTQDYGFYAGYNAYRADDGYWYHYRTNAVNAYRFSGGHHQAGFTWSYAPNQGAAAISWTDLMYLSAVGNLGIGTTNPTTKLYVNGGTGDAVNVGGGRIRGLNTTPVNADEAVPLTYLQSNYGTSASELWKGTINGNIWNGDSGAGNVGIGTTSPVSKLDVVGSSGDTYITVQQNSGGGAGLRFLRNPTGYDNGFKNNAGIFYITTSQNNFTSENNRMAVDYNGNVGIGGDITAGTDFTGASMVIKSGNVGIGTTNPTTKLFVNGGTGDAVNVGGGRIRGLNTTPVNADEAVPLTYLQSNYSPTLNTHKSINDANYTVLASDYVVGYSAITANRTVTLPDALCVPGKFFVILDESGQAGIGKTIIVDPEGSTPIIGQPTFNLMGPYNSIYVFCGNSAWFIL